MPTILKTIEKLQSFRKLEDGWRFGTGGPPAAALIARAEHYLRHALKLGIETANVFTGSDRQISLSFYAPDGRSIEIIFEPDNTITFAEDLKDQQVDFVEDISEVKLYQRIWQLHFPQANNVLFAPSIRETSMKKGVLSTARRSRHQVMEAGSQSSTATARLEPVGLSVSTSSDSTRIKPKSPVSTGSYPLTPCLTAA